MMPDFYLFILAILKASLITGVLPGALVTLYLERRKKAKRVVFEFGRIEKRRRVA